MLPSILLVSCLSGFALAETSPQFPKQNTTVLGHVRPRSVPLRVLALGDSITYGKGSTDNNGYRKLFVELAESGGPVKMIGSHLGLGNMSKNDNEGWNGYTIDAISQKATKSLEAKPNLVLLLAGTNNMFNASQASAASRDIRFLIDKVCNY